MPKRREKSLREIYKPLAKSKPDIVYDSLARYIKKRRKLSGSQFGKPILSNERKAFNNGARTSNTNPAYFAKRNTLLNGFIETLEQDSVAETTINEPDSYPNGGI